MLGTQGESQTRARLLIIDDEERNVRVLQHILQRSGYVNLCSTTDSRKAIQLFLEFEPDILLLDLRMPHLDGFELMQKLRPLIPAETYLPILVLTADVTAQARERALTEGAADFLTKPFDATEVALRIGNLLRTRFLNQHLEELVQERTREIKATQREVLERLARAAEFRDDDTGQHTRRVGEAAARLGLELGLSDENVKLLRQAAPLHDVGKIGIPDAILLKPGRLGLEEFEIMKRHTTIGSALLSGGHSDLIILAEAIARTHHERWDGTGYPGGLKEDDIPIEGRILAVVDVFDALTHERPYKSAWSVDEALGEMRRQSGAQFDPELANLFLGMPQDAELRLPEISERPTP